MEIFGKKNNIYLYAINNSPNMYPLGAASPSMYPLGAASPSMDPLGAASPIQGFNSIKKYDLAEVAYKQGYTNEE